MKPHQRATSILACLLLFAAGMRICTAKPPPIRFVLRSSVTYLYMRDVAAFYGMSFGVKDKTVTFTSGYSKIIFKVDSRLMSLNGVQAHLSRPITRQKNIFLMAKSDFQLLLEPILRPGLIPRKHVTTIVIDPGHGGKDVGAVSGKTYEKEINLQVATRLANKLRSKGYTVCMTRTADNNVTLQQRTAFAAKMDADLFISIHCNSASPAVTGIETYIATPTGDPPTGDNVPAKTSCPANAFNRDNAYFAFYTQRALLMRSQADDRGLRRRRFFVVRNINCPAILVEMGFMSNSNELARLTSPNYQEKLADALAEGITKYRDAVKPIQKIQKSRKKSDNFAR